MYNTTQHNTQESLCTDGLHALRKTDGGFFGGESYLALEGSYTKFKTKTQNTIHTRYAASYAMKFSLYHAPTADTKEFCMLLCAVAIGSAYVVTLADDYSSPSSSSSSSSEQQQQQQQQRRDDPYEGFSRFASHRPETAIALPARYTQTTLSRCVFGGGWPGTKYEKI